MMVLLEITWLLLLGVAAVLLLGQTAPNWQQKIIAAVFVATLVMPFLRVVPVTIDPGLTASSPPIQAVEPAPRPSPHKSPTGANTQPSQPASIETPVLLPNALLPWSMLLGGLWLFGVLVALTQQGLQLWRLQAIKRRAVPLDSASQPTTLISDEVPVPMLMAWGRCCILLPAATQQWPAVAQQQVLNHERRHHQRKDHWLLWLAVLVRTVYWFHPLVHWLFKHHKTVTELACDQDLMAQGLDPVDYAEALVACAHPNASQLFNGMASPPKQINQRLQALIHRPQPQPRPGQRGILLLLACGLLAGCVDWQLTHWVPAQQLIVNSRQDLPSIRQQNPPAGEVHLAVFYDGVDYGQTHVRLKLAKQNQQAWLSLGPLQKFNHHIHTWHLQLVPGTQFTGEYEVLGVEADGMVDGVAVGMIFTDESGQLRALQSQGGVVGDTPNFICSWPLGLYDEELIAVLPQLTADNPDSVRRLLCGAQLVDNGSHQLN